MLHHITHTSAPEFYNSKHGTHRITHYSSYSSIFLFIYFQLGYNIWITQRTESFITYIVGLNPFLRLDIEHNISSGNIKIILLTLLDISLREYILTYCLYKIFFSKVQFKLQFTHQKSTFSPFFLQFAIWMRWSIPILDRIIGIKYKITRRIWWNCIYIYKKRRKSI